MPPAIELHSILADSHWAIGAPLLGAAVSLATPSRTLAWLAAVAAAIAGAGLAFTAIVGGAALDEDRLGLFCAAVLACAGVAVILSCGFFLRRTPVRQAKLSVALLLINCGAWQGALIAAQLMELVAAVAAASIAMVAMVANAGDRDKATLNGALHAFSACATGAGLLFLGAVLLQRGAGVSALAGLQIADIQAPNTAALGASAIMCALALLGGVAPFHTWASVAGGRGDGLAPLVLGAIHIGGATACLVRFCAYAAQTPGLADTVTLLAGLIGATAALLGSVQAIGSSNLRRLMLHGVIAQAGIALLGASLGSPAGLASSLLQLVSMAAIGVAWFIALAATPGDGLRTLNVVDGLGRRSPIASLAILTAALSAMGMPLTTGFLARWRLVEAGIGVDAWWIVVLCSAASLAGVLYGGMLIERLYFRRYGVAGSRETSASWRLIPGLALSMLACISLAPGPLSRLAAAAAAVLSGQEP